jgi:hypothetical protein
LEGGPVVRVEGDDGPLFFTVGTVESIDGAIGCDDEWIAYLQPVRVLPQVKLYGRP